MDGQSTECADAPYSEARSGIVLVIARVARFYGWSDDEVMKLPLGRFLAYASALGILQAEESIRWLTLMNPGKEPDKLLRRLKQDAGFLTTKGPDTDTTAFLLNPNLAKKVTVVQKIE